MASLPRTSSVDDHATEANGGVVLVAHEGDRCAHVARRAPLAQDLPVHVPDRLAGGEDPAEKPVHVPRAPPVDEPAVAHPLHLLGAVAEDAAEGVVEEREAALQVDLVVALGDPGQDLAVLLLALPEGFLGLAALGDVAEAPHAPHRHAVEPLGHRVALEDPAVLELEHVEALGFGIGVKLLDAGRELLGVLELIEDVLQRLRVFSGLEQDRRDPPHLREALVAGEDLAAGVDDQDAVGRGFQGRLEE